MASTKYGTCVLLGIDGDIAFNLHSALLTLGWSVHPGPTLDCADVVFCGVGSTTAAVVGVAKILRALPLVIVGREPTEEAWLNALEAGAADYLCAGFECAELRWILNSLMLSRVATAGRLSRQGRHVEEASVEMAFDH